jgi:hypothetical protein
MIPWDLFGDDKSIKLCSRTSHILSIVPILCVQGNAQYVARYQVDADPLTNPATEAERLSAAISATGNTVCQGGTIPSFCTTIPGAEALFVCAQFPNDPNGVDTQPLFCTAAGGSMALGLNLDTGATCASVTTSLTQISTDVLAYINSLQAYDSNAWNAKIPVSEMVCQSLTVSGDFIAGGENSLMSLGWADPR